MTMILVQCLAMPMMSLCKTITWYTLNKTYRVSLIIYFYFQSTVIAIVPPVGPPVVVPVGRAVKDEGIYLDSRFKVANDQISNSVNIISRNLMFILKMKRPKYF